MLAGTMASHNKWTAEKWKEKLGWDKMTWKKLILFSREEADALVSHSEAYWAGREKKEITTWDHVPLGVQQLVFKRLGARLVGEGVPTIPPDDQEKLFIWRMRQAIRSKTQKYHRQDRATEDGVELVESSHRPFYDPVLDAIRQNDPSPSGMPPRP
ncbi:uncharacterized protein BKCO1_3800022 [Diplodia corticola]|uniref:Uncharacterized protein n=1 Tax=Diplodia corticola TaxID=236234 RepID=A0A1J9QWT0_9PEZI|nr:uncharacterized protein BKCO1_3800022 [Diplodia corticola]OJD32450.1 hypothetical protein BKCO1_3800022 [Diplodia corticola]